MLYSGEHTASTQINKLGAEGLRGLGAGLEEAAQAAERAIGNLSASAA